MQAAYGSAQDEVYFTLGQLSLTAIRDGGHDLAEADRFQKVGILLLVGLFALVLSIMVYFARRLTNDIVRPIETLQAAAKRLTEGFLDHRIELAKSAHSNEIEELADCFNEMASALSVSHQELERRATVDGLTGLANRASFSERLTGHVDSTDRRSETVSVLFVDIDDFKFVNDSIGHAAGDALLVAVAERLVASVRPSDYVARLGGDEFAIIVLGDEADASPSDSVAERVLAAFTRPFTLDGRSVPVAVSVGASTLRSDTLDSGSLVSEADFAMYTAKRAGKGRREVFHATVAAN